MPSLSAPSLAGRGRSLAAALALALASPAGAQQLETWRPLVPAAGLAAENGPGALWVNPANLAYDPDARFALLVNDGLDDAPDSLALTAGARGFGVGVHNLVTRDASGPHSNWSLDYATSLALPQRINVGLLLSWSLVAGGRNYAGYDAALSWRPLPWLGFGGVARNIGSPDPTGRAQPLSGGGVALRPFGPAVVLGGDFMRLFATETRDTEDLLHATVRLRPMEGLYLRGHLTSDAGPGHLPSVLQAGLGVEVFFQGVGAGAHLHADPHGFPGTRSLWVGTDEPGESVVRSGRRVPELTLSSPPPYEPRITLLSLDPGPSWLDVLERIRRVEEDPGVRGLVLTLEDPGLSWARYQELRRRIVALQERGKPVLVYLRGTAPTGAYYLSSAASQVVLHPAGDVELTGLASQLLHVRGLLELVGVEPQFVRRDEYKSAPETFTRTEPSEASLEQTNALLDDIYAELVAAIAEGRGLDASQVRELVDQGPFTAREAERTGLVDVLAYPDELEGLLAQVHAGPVAVTDLTRVPQPRSAWEDPDQIAVIYVEGAIVPGESSRGGLFGPTTTGSQTLARSLQRAARDRRVRAVVLRVDSPGGSAYASDEIWRAVELVKREGKPVVVSMGGVAASGGYYVSAGADAIWAEPTTLTGSIGVYSGKMVTERLLDDLGVGTTTLLRGRNADLRSSTRRWDDVQVARMQEMVDETYRQFKDRVAAGRGLTEAQVDAIAGGRVWSGQRALDVGLVDQLGGLQDAITDARERAGIPERRKVGLVSFSARGAALETLAPSLRTGQDVLTTRILARPVLDAIGDDLAAVRRVGSLLDPLEATMLFSMYPSERTWLLVPELLDP